MNYLKLKIKKVDSMLNIRELERVHISKESKIKAREMKEI